MMPCDDPYPWLSEFLCAYVDGEMPPAEQAAFDERLRGDAQLATYVSRLVQTRQLCCRSSAPKAPCDFMAALHRRLADEGLETPAPLRHAPQHHGTVRRAAPVPAMPDPHATALLVRSALLLLVLGAVAMARFGLHAEAEPHVAATGLVEATAALALAASPEAAPDRPAPATFVARRTAAARLAAPLAEPRRPAVRGFYAPSGEALLRIRAAR